MSLASIVFDAGTTCLLCGIVLCLRYYATISDRVLDPMNRNIGVALLAAGAILLIVNVLL
jgi:hypothetical protein